MPQLQLPCYEHRKGDCYHDKDCHDDHDCATKQDYGEDYNVKSHNHTHCDGNAHDTGNARLLIPQVMGPSGMWRFLLLLTFSQELLF